MKKILLGMACITGFWAGTASAQSSITLFGYVDAAYGFQTWKNKSEGVKVHQSGLFNGIWNSNAWGIKGKEDLGQGLTASFELESGFNVLNGSTSSSHYFKTAWVGLSSNEWGRVRMGRVGNAIQEYASFIAGISDEENFADIENIFSAAGSNKANNTIVYKSPTFSGVDFSVGYSFDTNGSSGTSNDEKIKLITSAIGYSKGPLTLSLGYDRLHSSAWAKNVHSWVAVAGYELKSVSLGAAVGQDINGRQSLLSSYLSNPAFATWGSGYVPDFKTTGLTFNATVPVGTAASVMVGWSGSRASSGFHNAYNLDKRQQNIYSAGYTYNLSKRTSFYVIAAYATGFAFQNVTAQQMFAGLDHSF